MFESFSIWEEPEKVLDKKAYVHLVNGREIWLRELTVKEVVECSEMPNTSFRIDIVGGKQ